MRKAAETIEESPVERAYVLEQIKTSLAQVRAGQGLTAEESLADLERYEAELDEADRARGVVLAR